MVTVAKVDLAGMLGNARARAEAETPAEQRGLPRYARLTRKDARVRPDQDAALSALAKTLMRRRPAKVERITENTLIRVAIDLLLAHADELRGSTEDELRDSVTSGLRNTATTEPPNSVTSNCPLHSELRHSGTSGLRTFRSPGLPTSRTPGLRQRGSAGIPHDRGAWGRLKGDGPVSEMRPPAGDGDTTGDDTAGSDAASPASEADDSAETARARKRAAMNAWREQNKDHVREYNRRWNAEHPDRVRELNRESARRATQRQRQVRERKERDRRYYIDNAERIREKSRAWRAVRAAEDPEGFRQARSAQRREWWKRRPRELRERDALAARDRGDAPAARERSRAYYQRNADRINAAKREHLREHPEKRREYQQRWREKERARKAAGLPPRNLHRTTPAERAANRTAADAFFTKVYPAAQIEQMRNGPPTPPELLARVEP